MSIIIIITSSLSKIRKRRIRRRSKNKKEYNV